MATHTPGPWSYRYEDLRGGRYHVVEIPGSDDTVDLHEDGNGEANARLIAVAPELLTNLQHIVHLWDHSANPSEQTIEEARAVIAKATGPA